jgi:membrane-bound metal-dependent hydrolase YbcI (DUF457 family)
MPSKRLGADDLLYIASRIPWRVAVGLALVSAVVLHLVADVLASPMHATRIEDLKYVALRSACGTFAAVGQFLVPLILSIGAVASYTARSRGVNNRVGQEPRR